MLQPHMHCCEKMIECMTAVTVCMCVACARATVMIVGNSGAGSICPAPPDPEPRSLRFSSEKRAARAGKRSKIERSRACSSARLGRRSTCTPVSKKENPIVAAEPHLDDSDSDWTPQLKANLEEDPKERPCHR